MRQEQESERVIKQQTIIAGSISLIVACTSDGTRYLSISSICKELHIDRPTQLRRIKSAPTLCGHLRQLTMHFFPGGDQKVYCLPVEDINPWLGGLQADTVKPPYQPILSVLLYDIEKIVDEICPLPPPLEIPFPQRWGVVGPIVDAVGTTQMMVSGETGNAEDVARQAAQQVLDAHLPMANKKPPLILPLFYHEEHTAFREASVARRNRWVRDAQSGEDPHFLSSTQLQVYVSRPSQPIGLEDAMKRIEELGPSTVLTARIAFLFWNARRNLPPPYAHNGWVAIGVEEFFLLRNLQMHSRAVSSDSDARFSDGYFEGKYIERLQRDLELLNGCYIRKWVTRENYYDSLYLRVIPYMERVKRSNEKDRLVKVAVHPEWMSIEAPHAFDRFTGIDERLVQLSFKTDIIAFLIGLFLTERWRKQALQELLTRGSAAAQAGDPLSPFREPISMRELLEGSVITIDEKNLTSRFAPRVEEALQKLFEHGILSEPVTYFPPIDKSRNWGRAWLDSFVLLLPRTETDEEMRRRIMAVEEVYQLTLFEEGEKKRLSSSRKRHRLPQ